MTKKAKEQAEKLVQKVSVWLQKTQNELPGHYAMYLKAGRLRFNAIGDETHWGYAVETAIGKYTKKEINNIREELEQLTGVAISAEAPRKEQNGKETP